MHISDMCQQPHFKFGQLYYSCTMGSHCDTVQMSSFDVVLYTWLGIKIPHEDPSFSQNLCNPSPSIILLSCQFVIHLEGKHIAYKENLKVNAVFKSIKQQGNHKCVITFHYGLSIATVFKEPDRWQYLSGNQQVQTTNCATLNLFPNKHTVNHIQ